MDAPLEGRGKRIAIAGAGPGGLSAAVALHQAGFDVTIYERHATTRAMGGAILLNAIGMHILQEYGCSTEDMRTIDRTVFRRYDGHPRVDYVVSRELVERSGAAGWISGTMRSEVYARLLAALPAGTIRNSKQLVKMDDAGDEVVLHFADGSTERTDLLIGAEGITSVVREQLWGPAELKDVGITVYLGWAEFPSGGIDAMICHHDDLHQLGYAPLRYHGKDCVEWWFVERTTDRPVPADLKAHVQQHVAKFADPVPRFVAATDPEHGLFRWVVKHKDPLPAWSKGRATLLGDAAHPTSPYAGYGAGMAIEDGFFLGQVLAGVDLTDRAATEAALLRYDEQRVEYTNRVTSFALKVGEMFHAWPWPRRRLRDFLLDHTRIPQKQMSAGFTQEAQALLTAILAAEGDRLDRADHA